VRDPSEREHAALLPQDEERDAGLRPAPPLRRPRDRTDVNKAVRSLTALLAISVIASVLAIGAVHVPTVAAIAPAAFAAATLGFRQELARKGAVAVAFPAALAAALAGYTLLQAAPLPMSLLERIAPASADIWARALMPLGEAAPRFASLSLDPGASIVEALKWLTYAAVFTAAAALSARRGATLGVALVFVSAALVALVTVIHGLAGMTRVYGFYEPSVTLAPWHTGPLLNPNTLAGYLNLGALSGMGLLFTQRPIAPRWVVAAGIALIVGVEVTSGSRGGVLALPVGVVALALLLRLQARARGRSLGTPSSVKWLLGVALAGGVLLAALGGTHATWAELYDKNFGKLEMLRWARPMLGDHTLFGVGRGAFESVFPAYRITGGHVVYTHAESFPLQWLAEWGVPVGLAALAAFAWALRPARLGATRSALAAGAFCGVVVLLLQNLVDLSLEIPSVCIAMATVLGSLWGDPIHVRASHAKRDRTFSGRVSRLAPAAAIAAGVVMPLAALRAGAPDIAADRSSLRAAYEVRDPENEGDRQALRSAIRAAMLRHPAEPYFPLVGAFVAYSGGHESAIPWLQRSLERALVNGRAHLLLAQVLASRGARKQAMLELRLSVEQDTSLVRHAGPLAVRWTKDFDELMGAVPEGKTGTAMLDELAVQAALVGRNDLRARCDQVAIERNSLAFGPRLREAQTLLAAMAPGDKSGACVDRVQCAREIEVHASALEAAQPDRSVAAQIRARLLLVEKRPDEAEALLAARCAQTRDRPECLRARTLAAAEATSPEKLTAASKDLLAASCLAPVTCAETATWLGDLRLNRGEAGSALAFYARAAREEPTEARWLKLADAASRAGAHGQAADALERVAQKRGWDDALRRRVAAERARVMGAVHGP
jgi:tetratricopeptide (TPR) repeat protein